MPVSVFEQEITLQQDALRARHAASATKHAWEVFVQYTFFPAVSSEIVRIWNRDDWGRQVIGLVLKDNPKTLVINDDKSFGFRGRSFRLIIGDDIGFSDWFKFTASVFEEDRSGTLYLHLVMNERFLVGWDPTAFLREVSTSLQRELRVRSEQFTKIRDYTILPETFEHDIPIASSSDDAGSAAVIVT